MTIARRKTVNARSQKTETKIVTIEIDKNSEPKTPETIKILLKKENTKTKMSKVEEIMKVIDENKATKDSKEIVKTINRIKTSLKSPVETKMPMILF